MFEKDDGGPGQWYGLFLPVQRCESETLSRLAYIHTYIHTVVRKRKKKDRAALGVVR